MKQGSLWVSARGALLALTVAGAALLVPSSALAIQAITVTTTRDGSIPGKTTLRQAIDQANAATGAVEIVLAARGTYALTECGPATDQSNQEGQLAYYGSAQLTIEGSGNTIRQTCPSDRVLSLLTSSLTNVNDATIAGGTGAAQPGGGIYNGSNGELDLKNDVFTGNHSDAAGGGVANTSAKLVVVGTTFVSNSGTELAGAIASIGPVELVKSTVSGNTGGTAPGSPAPVGGIAASNGLLMVYSTVQDNTAENVNVEQGGLKSYASVVGLSHPTPGQRFATCGITGGTKSLGYNFSADSSCGFGSGVGDKTHGNPDLRPNATSTGAFEAVPGPGSPLVNAIRRSACAPASVVALVPVYAGLRTDQFGTPRPEGPACDIGAIEVPFPTAVIHWSPRHLVAGVTVKFSGAASHEIGGSIKSYAWTFSRHGRASHGARVKHTFARRGRYTVTLTVTDANGEKTTVSTQVRVG